MRPGGVLDGIRVARKRVLRLMRMFRVLKMIRHVNGAELLVRALHASRAKIIRDTIAGLLMTMVTLHVFLIVFPIGTLVGFAQGLHRSRDVEQQRPRHPHQH